MALRIRMLVHILLFDCMFKRSPQLGREDSWRVTPKLVDIMLSNLPPFVTRMRNLGETEQTTLVGQCTSGAEVHVSTLFVSHKRQCQQYI